jgi:hypothetical protein
MGNAYKNAIAFATKAMSRKKGGTTFKFDKSIDSGPLNPTDDPALQKTIQEERIRRQVKARQKLEGV